MTRATSRPALHALACTARARGAQILLLLTAAMAGCADDPLRPPAPADAAFSVTALQAAGPARSIAFHSARAGNLEIYLASPGGADPVRLTFAAASDFYPDISGNGKSVVYTSKLGTAPSDIHMIAVAGGDPVNLTHTPTASEDWARFSPNGQQVAFHGNADGDNEIYVLDLRSGVLTQITSNAVSDTWVEWSPDGHRLTFRRGSDVWLTDLRTGETTQLTHVPAQFAQMAAWSPNGQQIAYMSFQAGYCSVFIMDADGSNPVNLTPKNPADANSAWCSRAPSWTHTGQILFMSFRPSTGGDIELFIMNADGTGLTRLTQSAGEDGGPTAR